MIYYLIMKKCIIFYILTLLIIFSLGNFIYAEEGIEVNSSNLNIYSDCALLINKETGDILYEKNAYSKTYPASTTKMLTAIIVLERLPLNELVTVSESALNSVPSSYTKANLQVRRKISCRRTFICNAYSFCK